MIGLTELESTLSQSSDPDNPTAQELEDIFGRVKTIAVVGMSANPKKPARRIPAYLMTKGYSIIPVTPCHDEILGIPATPIGQLLEGGEGS